MRANPRDHREAPGAAEIWFAVLLLSAASACLFATSPTNGDFWWQDAPRHALNGAFVKDLLATLPIHDPAGWAMRYYVQYPALTILFYPPAFYLVEAGAYAIFGVSHAVAQLAVVPYTVLLGVSAYAIARMSLPFWSAIGVGLLTIGTPLSALWGRQVMLDIPAYALMLCSVWCLMRHLRTERTSDLLLAMAALVAAVYTKQTVVFMVPALLVGFLVARGPSALLERRVMVMAMIAMIAAIPMAYLTIRFGQVNIESVQGRSIDLSRWSGMAWLFYARQMPAQLGWPVLIAGVGGLMALLRQPAMAGIRWLAPMLGVWLLFGYLFFSFIGVREPRHDMMILFPVILGTAFAFHAIMPAKLAQIGVMALAGATFVFSVAFVPTPVITGYQDIATTIARLAPPNAVVLFSGYRDGNFIYDLRTHEERRDITTIRADKILLRLAVERERGVGQTDEDEAAIAARIKDLGISLVVAQADFWTDLRQMARLERVLSSASFEEVARFPITGELSTNDGRDREGGALVRIYRPTYAVEPPRGAVGAAIPFIDSQGVP